MAVTTTFKQECPTCGATVKINDSMIGKKVECTKCKDKFIAEKPDEDEEEETPRSQKKAGANGKKPAKSSDDDDDAVQVKSGKGKAKAKKDEDDDDEPEAKPKGKSKQTAGSNKLTIGLGLAVVGVLVLGVAAFFLLTGGRRSDDRGGRVTPGGSTKAVDDSGDKKIPAVPTENPKVEPTTTPLSEAELSRLSNLLPNDTEHVFHLYCKDVFGPTGSLHEAIFKTPGALDNVTMTRKLGFSLASVDDALCAERYSAPSWKYAVLHFKDTLDERKLKAALNLKLAGAPIEGLIYYKMTEAHPVFDVLGQFTFGIPNWYRYFETRQPDQPTFVRIHDAQTLIVGDQVPVEAFLKARGEFKPLSERTAPPPAPNPAPGDKVGGEPGKTDGEKAAPKPGPGKGRALSGGAKVQETNLGVPSGPTPDDRPGRFPAQTPVSFFETQAPQDPAPKQDPPVGANPPGGVPLVVRDDMYLTIRPALKAILDRLEARKPDSQDKVLLSSATDMVASRVETSLPEFRDRVVRRPRQFWDITVMLNEPTPRIRTLGTVLTQRGETQRYRLRNDIGCSQVSDASAIKKEIMDTTSFTVAQFLKNLVSHEVRLPELPSKEPKKAPQPDPKALVDQKKPAPINYSRMTVNRDASDVEFVLDLVLDNATLTQLNRITTLAAGALRVEMEAGSRSPRHWLGTAGKTMADKGMSDRDVPPGRFPPGAFLRAKTPFRVDQEPRNRISWMAGLLPYLGQQHLYNRLQFDQSWRDPSNWMAGHMIVPQFLDPSYADYLRRVAVGELPLDFGATHYVGVAGIGLDAASYSRSDPATAHKRGVFSNDGSASLDEIQKGRGLSNTIAMIQIPHDGVTGVSPWIAGGGATLRGVPEKNSIAPFILSRDKNGKPIEHQGKRGTFVVMADGSVRFVDQTVSDDVFKAMATVQGPAPDNFNPATNPSTPLVPVPDKRDDELPTIKPLDKKADVPAKPIEKSPTPEKKPLAGQFSVPGQFSVDTPPGFAWQAGSEMKLAGITIKIYLCLDSKNKSNMSLSVDERKMSTDEEKRKAISSILAKLDSELSLPGQKGTIDMRPSLKSPIPARVEIRVRRPDQDGAPRVFHTQMVFGKKLYIFTVNAPNEEEARSLLRVTESLKE